MESPESCGEPPYIRVRLEEGIAKFRPDAVALEKTGGLAEQKEQLKPSHHRVSRLRTGGSARSHRVA